MYNKSSNKQIAGQLAAIGLKVTPQRIAVLKAVKGSGIHPTAEDIYREVVRRIPGLSQTTVYNILDAFVEKKLVNRVHTDADVMRYDGETEEHHHLFGESDGRVEDFFDPELDRMLNDYFNRKQIEGFTVSRFQLLVQGTFVESTTKQK